MNVSTCIGCGCDDLHACVDDGVPCSWLIKDPHLGLGVCSMCPGEVRRWHKGERKLAVKALVRQALPIIEADREMLIRSCSVPGTGRIPDPDDRAELRRLDRWLRLAREAVK